MEFRDLAPGVRHFVFEVEGGEPFCYEPGQFVELRGQAEGRPMSRAYSICCAPQGNRFELCLNRVPNGEFTKYLFNLKPGDRVPVIGPSGSFVLREPVSDSVFVATGTGIAPIRAMLQDPRLWASGRECTLVYGARNEAELLYRGEFEELERRQARFHYWPVLSRPSGAWRGRTGYVQPYVREAVGQRRDLDVYVCGRPAMVEDVRKMLLKMGLEPGRIVHERYE